MLKNRPAIPLLILLFLLQVIVSCSPEEEEETRTRQIEWEELDATIKKLEARGENVDTTNRMVFYIVRTSGEGATPQEGDSCKVEYWGYVNNRLFDDSKIYKNNIWEFPYRYKKEVHPVLGLLDGIGQMNKGAEVEMYIPSDLAFGANGTNDIPPFTTLFYRAILHDVVTK